MLAFYYPKSNVHIQGSDFHVTYYHLLFVIMIMLTHYFISSSQESYEVGVISFFYR